ncbi:hypothetical protein [Kaistia sp. MMO-174]|uniref:hypothetical protein n=1 Tax=Kaistia sp. MMO-174 TaxID=3081256 RepID=UPI003015C979
MPKSAIDQDLRDQLLAVGEAVRAIAADTVPRSLFERRQTELLEANNRLLMRARSAEAALAEVMGGRDHG